MKRYEIVLKKWVNGSGFQYEETVDWLSKFYSAEEFLKNLDEPLYTSVDSHSGEDTLVEIRYHPFYDFSASEVLSKVWAKDFYGLD